MKIVNRKTFLAMPAGTMFSKFEPCIFGDLLIKGDTTTSGEDFFCQQIADAIDSDDCGEFASKLFDARDNGTSMRMDFDCEFRDGLFDDDQLFAVWEVADVRQLIERLRQTLPIEFTVTDLGNAYRNAMQSGAKLNGEVKAGEESNG